MKGVQDAGSIPAVSTIREFMYAIRYESNGILTWWCRAFSDDALLHEVKNCLCKYPHATIQVVSL